MEKGVKAVPFRAAPLGTRPEVDADEGDGEEDEEWRLEPRATHAKDGWHVDEVAKVLVDCGVDGVPLVREHLLQHGAER